MTEDDFNPPPFDLDKVKNFRQAHPLFDAISAEVEKSYKDVETNNPRDLDNVDMAHVR